jgi:hypothetical protein
MRMANQNERRTIFENEKDAEKFLDDVFRKNNKKFDNNYVWKSFVDKTLDVLKDKEYIEDQSLYILREKFIIWLEKQNSKPEDVVNYVAKLEEKLMEKTKKNLRYIE